MRVLLVCLTLLLNASPAIARQALGLAAPEPVLASGLLKHILPRFSLKTSVRVTVNPAGPMRLATQEPGVAVFRRAGTTYFLRIEDGKDQIRFRDWMLSDIGKNTIESFQPDSGEPFSARFETVETEEAEEFDGNAARGAALSLAHCGRCHVVGAQNRMKGLGSTPSFAVLRSLADWTDRFRQFYVRNPHAAFTQIAEVTPPFDPERPPPIAPVRMTLQDLDAILAFVAATDAADLGAPLQTQ
ncbi:hypothetical protein QO034_07685 [Sedimentitalea sp. JM2-8]|uniref:Cytochrome c domain-containing protein n=1 Tax=Sedimentitalea xiamensis TaxID=3050037 RepID=A0ABT7FCZ3_9RHOB|nr:c-type cytochrome [Sedimentitalea xiamensis]MDK3072986.1 hypothetical protein [Sedimentitalea xiamensis]